MEYREISEDYSVSGQIQPEDVAAIKEADLTRHLVNGTAAPAAPAPEETPAKGAADEAKKPSLANEDYQLYEALNLLKGLYLLKSGS